MAYHFGVKVLEGKRGLKLTRESYAVVSNINSLVRFSADIYADDEAFGILFTQTTHFHHGDCLWQTTSNLSTHRNLADI
ncbi:hypothetical protein V7087_03650 [Neobacillus niacini]|uniref:hypothetical protein n=1 Tax=Neobacillus niacini TaxID=86668 RepID=UPI002FFDA78C